jgi:Holliday junction DNA helicase RuvB
MNRYLKQGLRSFWNCFLQDEGEKRFKEIVGHNDIKLILNRAVISKKPVNVLLLGKSGIAKTMFLTEIMRSFKESLFVVGSNTTKAGLVNQLFHTSPKFVLIDELEKMSMVDQTSLLHLMETGIISETKIRKTRQMELSSWVFATANCCEKIIEPLLSRFVILEVPQYTYEEFCEIAVTKLGQENVSVKSARFIAENVWFELDSRDIRDVIKVARLLGNQEDIRPIIGVMKKYSKRDNKE